MTAGRYTVTLLIGAPGAGKGTQARYVCEALGIPHVASGDLLRDHRRRGTTLGEIARSYMDQGDLVPDELVVKMVVDRLGEPDAANGVLLDGFPRTLAQAKALDGELAARGGGIRTVLYLDVSAEALVARVSGRRICNGCTATFHVALRQLPNDGSCPDCGDRLIQRADNADSVAPHWVAVYLRETTPVLEYYRRHGLVHAVDGNRTIEAIKADLLSVFQRRMPALAAS